VPERAPRLLRAEPGVRLGDIGFDDGGAGVGLAGAISQGSVAHAVDGVADQRMGAAEIAD